MNASPALPTRPAPNSSRGGSPLEALPVPAKWRVGQIVVLLLIAALAAFYFRASAGEPRVISDYLGFFVLAGLTWLATPTAGTIAASTLQEALRRRWVVGFLLFSMVVIGFSGTFSFNQPGEEMSFLRDTGTGFIIAMTLLISIFLGVSLVPPEIERRTIFTILSKPVNRLEFLIGKFLGLCLTLLFCMVLLGTFFLVVYTAFSLKNGGPNVWAEGSANNPQATLGFQLGNLSQALILNYGQLCVMAALSMMLSLIVTPITAITFCFLAFFGGQMSSYWSHLGGEGHAEEDGHSEKGLNSVMQKVVKVVYYALPRMDHFDVRGQLVRDEIVTFPFVWKAWSAGLLYIAVLLIIGYLVFSDREF
jgi:Cu-processing system permease protein